MLNKGYLAFAVGMALSSSAFASNGGVQDFLDDLRNFESGINPAKSQFYLDNLDNPILEYAKVEYPGRLVRDCTTGSMIKEWTTVHNYFKKLGLDTIYSTATPHDPEMFKTMQYQSKNAWGFVGYQLGEAIMIDAGYYSPKTVTISGKEYDSFYMFVPDETWIGCKTEALAEIEGSGGNKVYVTDTNRWEGTFVGKNGIHSFADLLIPAKQELVMRDAMHFNYKILSKLLADANLTWDQVLKKSWIWDDKDTGNSYNVQSNMSGILAAAHLRGAWGTAKLLISDKLSADETNTSILKYVYKFRNYNTIFDVPGDSTTQGSIYDEVLTAGWGNDTVILGGGNNTLKLNEQAGSTTTVTDFVVGKDKIVLSGWQDANALGNLTVADISGATQLQFAGQTVVLNNVSAASVQANPDAVILQSKVYPLAWNTGKVVVNGFNPLVDVIEGSAGIGFKHLKAFQTPTSVVVGPQAEDGGIYASYELVGLSLADLNPDMFANVTGSYDRLGYIVPLDHTNWGWNMTLTVDSFDAAKTVITVPSNAPVPFSAIKLTQNVADTEITVLEPFARGDKKKIILKNTDVTTLSGANFAGFTGNYSEATIDIPVFYNITASVIGTGGSISPTPNAQGVIVARGGADFEVTFNPDSGFKVAEIIVDGISYPSSSNYVFANLGANADLKVRFEAGTSCPLAWDPNKIYVGGDEVTYNGKIYRAGWWNTNNKPDAGGPWSFVANCQ